MSQSNQDLLTNINQQLDLVKQNIQQLALSDQPKKKKGRPPKKLTLQEKEEDYYDIFQFLLETDPNLNNYIYPKTKHLTFDEVENHNDICLICQQSCVANSTYCTRTTGVIIYPFYESTNELLNKTKVGEICDKCYFNDIVIDSPDDPNKNHKTILFQFKKGVIAFSNDFCRLND